MLAKKGRTQRGELLAWQRFQVFRQPTSLHCSETFETALCSAFALEDEVPPPNKNALLAEVSGLQRFIQPYWPSAQRHGEMIQSRYVTIKRWRSHGTIFYHHVSMATSRTCCCHPDCTVRCIFISRFAGSLERLRRLTGTADLRPDLKSYAVATTHYYFTMPCLLASRCGQ